MLQLVADMTPVLNIDADEIVMLPLEHPVVSQYALTTIDDLNVKAVNNEIHSDLVVKLNLDGSGSDVSEDYFVERCREAEGCDSRVLLSHEGYRHIYRQLRKKHLSHEFILKNIASIISDFFETTALRILNNAEIEHDHLSYDEKQVAAANALEADTNYRYETTYEISGNLIMLCRTCQATSCWLNSRA